MKRIVWSLFGFILLTSCGGNSGGSSGGGGNEAPIRQEQNESASDICNEAGACTDFKSYTYEEFLQLSIGTHADIPQTQKGLQVSHHISKTEISAAFNPDTGQVEQTNCQVTFEQVRTVAQVESKAIYVEEKKNNISVTPQNDACNLVLTYPQYKTVIIAKENREDIDGTYHEPTQEELDLLKNFVFETFMYKGIYCLKMVGTYESQAEPPSTITVKVKLHHVNDLTSAGFVSKMFEDTTTESDKFNSQSLTTNRVVAENVDVSHINISTMNPADIVDRTYVEY